MGHNKEPIETTLSNRLMENPLISFTKANYSSSDFNYYYDGTMNAFDDFYKKYNLVLLLCNRTYQNFPDGSEYKFDLYNMEHSLGITSYGQSDIDAVDLLDNMLQNVVINQASDSIKQEFNKKTNEILRIINTWNTNHIINDYDYNFINQLLKDYKNYDDRLIQSYLIAISRILTRYSYENKVKLIKYNPSIENRHKNIINDLVHFIDIIDNPQIKSILFNNNYFDKLHEKEFNGKDNFDEKSLVIGYFTNYLSTKYDLNPDNKGLGLDVGKLIEEAKNKYFDFYTEKVISDTMKNDSKNIIRKLKKILNEKEGKESLNKIVNTIINQKTITNKINKNNINYYMSLANTKDLSINNMLLLKNISKDIPNIINETENEIENLNIKLLELEELKEKLESNYKNKNYNNLSDKEFKNIINTKIRSNYESNNELEKELIEITRRYKNIKTKIANLKNFEDTILLLEEKTKNYTKLISKKLIEHLEDYIDGKKIIEDKHLKTIINNLLYDKYIIPIKTEARTLYKYPKDKEVSAKYLPNSKDEIRTKELELKIDNKDMSDIFKDLDGYSIEDNDIDNSLKLLSELSDRYALIIAYDLYQNNTSIDNIVKEFKEHPKRLGKIHLTHSLMKNEGVKKYLEKQFNTKTGVSFNYDKIMYKCNSMSSIDELINSRVETVITARKANIKGISLTPEEEQKVNNKISNIECKYIMVLGGESDTRTLVYLTETPVKVIDSKGKTTYKTFLRPLHSIRRTKENGLSAMFTKQEFLDPNKDRYLPDRRNDNLKNGIELEPSKPSTINIKR